MAEYDPIAEMYREAKKAPWRKHIEEYSFLQLLGDLSGKSVVDLACGEGHYTRKIKKLGADRVVGVDLSARMIELAREEEARQPLGIEYQVQDVTQLDVAEQFDVVAAAYLLNYARTAEELETMCRAVARCLKPGGRFVTVNTNPDWPPDHFHQTRKYGFVVDADGPLREGTRLTFTFFVNGRSFQFDNYHLSRKTHEIALQKAGMNHVRWHRPQLAPDSTNGHAPDFWQELVDYPAAILLESGR